MTKEMTEENKGRPSKIFLKKRKEMDISPNDLYNILKKFRG
ncbi:MAG: hypothetical protein ACOYU0_08635 [Nitrospirota bacterium]